MHGITVSYPAGWSVQSATQPWTGAPFFFREPAGDFLYHPSLTDHLFLALASRSLAGSSTATWATDLLALEGCDSSEPVVVDGAEGLLAMDCGMAILSTEDRGYLMWLYVSSDDPQLREIYGAAWFQQVLATVRLHPQDARVSPTATMAASGGGLLAFIRDGDVYLSGDDGSEPVRVITDARSGDTNVSNSRWLFWSHDGIYLAVAAVEQTLLLDTRTMEVSRLSGDLGEVQGWAPDSQSILVNDSRSALEIFDLEEGTSRPIGPDVANFGGRVCQPVWSPDGRWIAGVHSRSAIVMDIQSREWSRVGTDAGYGCGPFTGWDAPTWSADSERIAFVSGPSPVSSESHPTTITVANRDGSAAIELTASAAPWPRPLWSPDGQWIAYRRPGGLGLIRPDGSDPRLLVEGEVDRGRIAWTADSAHIEFGRPEGADPYGPTELWTVEIATGVAEPIDIGGLVADFARQPLK